MGRAGGSLFLTSIPLPHEYTKQDRSHEDQTRSAVQGGHPVTPTAYTAIYQRIRPRMSSHQHARNQAWTRLRYQYPDRYQTLYAQERASGV